MRSDALHGAKVARQAMPHDSRRPRGDAQPDRVSRDFTATLAVTLHERRRPGKKLRFREPRVIACLADAPHALKG
jgi:hypothetical protein